MMPIGELVDIIKMSDGDYYGDYTAGDYTAANNLFWAQYIFTIMEFITLSMLSTWHIWVAARLRAGWVFTLGWFVILSFNVSTFTLKYTAYNLAYSEWIVVMVIVPLLPWATLFVLWIFRPQYFYTVGGYCRHRRLRRSGHA